VVDVGAIDHSLYAMDGVSAARRIVMRHARCPSAAFVDARLAAPYGSKGKALGVVRLPGVAGVRRLVAGTILPARAQGQEDGVSGTGEAPGSVPRSGGVPASAQGLLFTEDLPVLDEHVGYRGPTACRAAGITYRQLDYWARTGLVEPSVRPATGSGTQRLYSFRDILVLKVVKRLLDTGVSLQQIRVAVSHLRERGVEDLAQITLMSDGASVYECTSADEVIDLVQGGQGVFGIAVGRVWREVEGSLAELPGERPGEEPADHPDDELASRRRTRATG
jgi:DNA-binding transcriptional MerR regulator